MTSNTSKTESKKICRLCLCSKPCLLPITIQNTDQKLSIAKRITYVVPSIQINENDKLSQLICNPCLCMVDKTFSFKRKCERTNAKLTKKTSEKKPIVKKRKYDEALADLQTVANDHKYCASEPTINNLGLTSNKDFSFELLQLVKIKVENNEKTEEIRTENAYYIVVNKQFFGQLSLPVGTKMETDDLKQIIRFVDSQLAQQKNYDQMSPFNMKLFVYTDKLSKIRVETNNNLSIDVQLNQDISELLKNESFKMGQDKSEKPIEKSVKIISNKLVHTTKKSNGIPTETNSSDETFSLELNGTADSGKDDQAPIETNIIGNFDRIQEMTSKDYPQSQKTFKCMLCKIQFNTAELHLQHLRKHNEPSPQCLGCLSRFKDISHLLKHMKDCSKLPIKSINLNSLSLKNPLAEMPFQCELCPKSFLQLANWERHKRTVHKPVNEKFKCGNCDKIFTNKNLFRRHQFVHCVEQNVSSNSNTNSFNYSINTML